MTYEEFEKNVLRALDDSEIDDLNALEELNSEWFMRALKENIER